MTVFVEFKREQVLGNIADQSVESMTTTSYAGACAVARPSTTLIGSMAIDAVALDPGIDLDNEEHHLTSTDHPSTTIIHPILCQEEEERQQAQLLLAARRLAIQEQELAAGIAAEERMWEARLRQEEGLLALRRAERAAELDRDRALVAMQTDMAHRLAKLREERDTKVVAFERARCDRLAVEDQEVHQHALARQKLLTEKEQLTRQLRLGQGLGLGIFVYDGETAPMDGSQTTAIAATAITTTASTRAAGFICDGNKDEDALNQYSIVASSLAALPEVAQISPPAPPVDRSRDSFQVAMRRDRDRAAANRAAANSGGGGIRGDIVGIVDRAEGGGSVAEGVVVALEKDKASAVNRSVIGDNGSSTVDANSGDGLLIAASKVGSSDSSVHVVGDVVSSGGSSGVNGVSSPSPLPQTLPPSSPLPLPPSSSSPSPSTTLPPPPPLPRAAASAGSALLEEIKSFRGTFDFTTTAINSANTRDPSVGRSKPWIRPSRPASSVAPSRGSAPVYDTSGLPLGIGDTVTRTRANLFGPSPRPRSVSATLARPGGGIRASAHPSCRSDTDSKGTDTAVNHPKPIPRNVVTNTRAASTARLSRSSRSLPSSSSAQAPVPSKSMAVSARRQPFVVITTQPRPHSRPRPNSQPCASGSGSWLESPPPTPFRADDNDNHAISARQSIRIDIPNTSPYPQQGQGESIGIRQGLTQRQEQTKGQGPAVSRDYPSPTRRPVHTTRPATTNHPISHPPAVPSYTSPSRQGLALDQSRPSPDLTKWTQSLRLADEGTAAISSSPSKPKPPFVVDISLAPDPDTR